MELWIRSQNKDRIVKANAVMVTTFQELVAIHCYIDKDTSVWLGNYKTKERALEILDEIQNKIWQNQSLISLIHNVTNLKGHEEEVTKLFKDIIYEMPLD